MKEPFEKPALFDHKKLVAYQRRIGFVTWTSDLLDAIPAKVSVCDQLDLASTVVPLTLTEGNGNLAPANETNVVRGKHSTPQVIYHSLQGALSEFDLLFG